MKVQIKQALLEGHTPEVIVEMAVHANHPELSKINSGNTPARNEVAELIRANRSFKNEDPTYANYYDNNARFISQTGNLGLNTRDPLSNKYSKEGQKMKRFLQVPEVLQIKENMKRNGELANGLNIFNPSKVYASGELAQQRLFDKMSSRPRAISSAKK